MRQIRLEPLQQLQVPDNQLVLSTSISKRMAELSISNTCESINHNPELLDVLAETEVQSQSQSNVINQTQQSQVRDLAFQKYYGHEMIQQLIENDQTLGNIISRHGIGHKLRANMINWMIEVFANYQSTCTPHVTLIRAINLMDYYLLKATLYHRESDMHLIGIACMFVATKLEDIYHISILDFVERISHKKFTIVQIKQMEFAIMEALSYDVTFPTSLDYLQNVYYQPVSIGFMDMNSIKDTSIFVLKKVLHDVSILKFSNNLIATAVFCYVLQGYFIANDMDDFNDHLEIILKNVGLKSEQFTSCSKFLQQLIIQFEFKYPGLNNLELYQ